MNYIKSSFPAVGLFFLILAVISPANGWLDSSELSSGAFLLGVSHPPGQPLYSILGKISQFLPLGNLAFRTNLLSALFMLASLYVFLKILRKFFPELREEDSKIMSGAIALYFFLTFTFLIQATRTEVYSLNLFLLLAVFYSAGVAKNNALAFFLFGLSWGCHPLSALFASPMLALLYEKERVTFAKVASGLFFLFLGASVYLYLPLRAYADPVYNFGAPGNIQNLHWVISARLYKAYNDIEIAKVFDNIISLFRIFIDQVNPFFVLLGFAGIFFLVIRRAYLGGVLLLLLLLNSYLVVVNMHFNPDNPDLHGYIMISVIAIAMGTYFALICLKEKLLHNLGPHANKRISLLLGIAFIALPVIQAGKFLPEFREKNDWTAHYFGKVVTEDLPYNSTLFTGSFATYAVLNYRLFSEGFRPDIKLLYSGFLGNDGYFENLERNYPELGIESRNFDAALSENLLSYIYRTGSPVYLELAIKEKEGRYGLRYDEKILARLSNEGWFFSYLPGNVGISGASFDTGFWDEKILPCYEGADFEFKKNVILTLYLQIEFFRNRGESEKTKALLSRGLKLAPDFEQFAKISREMEPHGNLRF